MANLYDYFNALMSFEEGLLEEDEIIELFVYLLNSRIINSLQGSYQRTAQDLIDCKQIVPDGAGGCKAA